MSDVTRNLSQIDAGDPQAAFLEGACRGDSALRQRLERMLAVNKDNGSFLEKPNSALAAEFPDDAVGARIRKLIHHCQ